MFHASLSNLTFSWRFGLINDKRTISWYSIEHTDKGEKHDVSKQQFTPFLVSLTTQMSRYDIETPTTTTVARPKAGLMWKLGFFSTVTNGWASARWLASESCRFPGSERRWVVLGNQISIRRLSTNRCHLSCLVFGSEISPSPTSPYFVNQITETFFALSFFSLSRFLCIFFLKPTTSARHRRKSISERIFNALSAPLFFPRAFVLLLFIARKINRQIGDKRKSTRKPN